jgi:hypothetical protein
MESVTPFLPKSAPQREAFLRATQHRSSIADAGDLPPVWPYADGEVRGYSFVPLHKNVPQAALEDERLYELPALVDALRNGRARERQLAGRELTQRLEVPTNAKSKS